MGSAIVSSRELVLGFLVAQIKRKSFWNILAKVEGLSIAIQRQFISQFKDNLNCRDSWGHPTSRFKEDASV